MSSFTEYLDDHKNNHRIYVNAMEIENSRASSKDPDLVSVEIVVYHKICAEANKHKKGDMVAVVGHWSFEEPIVSFDTEDNATRAILDMLEAMEELPMGRKVQLRWKPDMNAEENEILEGVDDVAVRVSELVRRRMPREVGMVMVVETVLPPWMFFGYSSAAPAA